MGKSKILPYLFSALILISFANAATVYGTVYDLSLKKVGNARVEIDTNPKQFLVAQNGSYSFNVPDGIYTIKAQLVQKNEVIASVEEDITISQEGSYVLDLILLPDVESGIENPGIDINGSVVEGANNNGILLAGFAVLFVLGIAVGAVYFMKTRKKEPGISLESNEKTSGEDLDEVINIIKKEGGRTTQKDIRKQIPLSEAKISLMIAELEHKGAIEKIKKGRGNIIILKKK